ncbi:hypothetical protein BsWGS_14486 [Bradybaena similaris]
MTEMKRLPAFTDVKQPTVHSDTEPISAAKTNDSQDTEVSDSEQCHQSPAGESVESNHISYTHTHAHAHKLKC